MADMLVEQRQELLLRELHATGAVRVAELAQRFGVSTGTIRRDLQELADLGRLTKVRGGAILLDRASSRPDTADEPAAPPAPEAAPPAGDRTLGLLVPSATYYYPRVLAGVREVAARRGARVVIGLTNVDRPRDVRQIEELCDSGVAGILAATTGPHHLPEETLAALRDCGRPYVLMERQPLDPYEPCQYVITDHRQGAFLAVKHLRSLGHDRVALYLTDTPTASVVREGWTDAVRALGLDPAAPVIDAERTALGSSHAARQYDAFIDGCLAGGVRAALVHSDHDAIELLQRLRARGMRSPEDLALIAYDDEIAALAEVPLTAVSPPKRQLGELAAEMLLDQLDAHPSAPRRVTMQPRLIIRRSCGAKEESG
ncbi:substrate-binding domain-containing protein [Streptomyces avicenniae]|uniref:substrate-binding domain-containing protein n=1 Tax=Streptomyces avicenniae TaxID=500153 RepID=UPI000AA10BA5|nr:substrate-binding domain-containing protein [Streptomyces avicenniae]